VVKDGGIPADDNTESTLFNLTAQAGLEVAKEQHIKENDVAFTLWFFKQTKAVN